MPLPPLDLLAPVVSLDATRFFRGFHTLAIHDRCRGVGMASRTEANRAAPCLVDALPHPVQAPLAECCVGCLPWWILAWQLAPGTAGAQDIKERVDEQPQRPGARPATPCWSWEQRCELHPFGIREVTGRERASIHGRARHRRCLLRTMRVGGLWHALGCMGPG